MTRRRSLKRRIRARMARTGESYTTARRHVTSSLEAESGPAGGHPGSRAGAGPRQRRPILIAAVGLALVGAAVAAVIVTTGGGGSKDTEARYAGLTSASPPSAIHTRAADQVPCSEVLRPGLIAIDRPEKCFRLHGRGPTGRVAIPVAIQKACGGAHPNPPKGPCAFDLPPEQRPLVQVESPSG
jgi:hypothetical protein